MDMISTIKNEQYDIIKLEKQNLVLEKRLEKLEKTKKNSDIKFFLLVGLCSVLVLVGFHVYSSDGKALVDAPHALHFLKGDKIDLGYTWNLNDEQTLTISFVNAEALNEQQLEAAKSAILSKEILEVDDSWMHKGPKGQVSIFYEGWAGALNSIETENKIPRNFKIVQNNKDSDVIITFTNARHSEGYSGYANSLLDENVKQILRSYVTIYDIENLGPYQMNSIVKHEVGHLLGLGHSTDPDDLMYEKILTTLPHISECSVNAIAAMYDTEYSEKYVCEK